MDAAEMVSEGKLKQGFFLATLVSTVAGTFITSINLYDRLIEQRRQKKLDRGQNKRIKELEQRLNEAEEEKERIKEESTKGTSGGSDGDNEFRNSLQQNGKMVQNEYNRYFANLGPKFAEGDLVAQNQIQSQIILLQGSVIKLLEEAILTGTLPDLNRLYNTSEFARESSIRALRDQYQRLLDSAPPRAIQQQRRPTGPMRRISSTPSLRGDRSTTNSTWSHGAPLKKAVTHPSNAGEPLFCRCAREMQYTSKPLHSVLADDRGAAVCAGCGVGVDDGDDAEGCRSWRIEKELAVRAGGRRGSANDDRMAMISRGTNSLPDSEIVVLTYLLTRRFIFKCHREDSGYACYLCCLYNDRDTLCRSEEGLVNHVTSKHSVREYSGDRDIKELGRSPSFR